MKADSSSSGNTREVLYMEFLKSCLDKVSDLEREVREVEKDIENAGL